MKATKKNVIYFGLGDFCSKDENWRNHRELSSSIDLDDGMDPLASELSRFQYLPLSLINIGVLESTTLYNCLDNQSMSEVEVLLAIVVGKYLIVTNDCGLRKEGADHRTRSTNDHQLHRSQSKDIKILLDLYSGKGKRVRSEDVDRHKPTYIVWLNGRILVVGFDSGLVICFDCKSVPPKESRTTLGPRDHPSEDLGPSEAAVLLEFRGQISPVRSINHQNDRLWILYENNYLVAVLLDILIDIIRSALNLLIHGQIPINQVLQGKSDELIAFKMTGHSAVYDFAFVRTVRRWRRSDMFELRGDDSSTDESSQSILVSGADNALAVYNLASSKLAFQDAEKLKQLVKDKVSTTLSKSLIALLGYGSSSYSYSYSKSSSSSETIRNAEESPDAGISRTEQRAIPLTSVMDFQDSKRRIQRLSTDPGGSGLVAAADSLGRVMLFDSCAGYCCVVRLWKGLRDARFAWCTYSTDSPAGGGGGGLCLSIYAPLLGLVSMYQMRHGPCLRIVPVGLNCQILSLRCPSAADGGGSSTRSYLLRYLPEYCGVEMLPLDPAEVADSDLDIEEPDAATSEVTYKSVRVLPVESGGGEGGGGEGERGGSSDDESSQREHNITEQAKANLKCMKRIRRTLLTLLQESKKGQVIVNEESSTSLRNQTEKVVAEEMRKLLLSRQHSSLPAVLLDFRFVVEVDLMIESMELYGNLNTEEDGTEDLASTSALSPQFHRGIISCLSDLLKTLRRIGTDSSLRSGNVEELSPSRLEGVVRTIEAEIRRREQALLAFESLLELFTSNEMQSNSTNRSFSQSSTVSSSSSSSSLVGEPIGRLGHDSAALASICRENTMRAEALCWTIRALKKIEHMHMKGGGAKRPNGSVKTIPIELRKPAVSTLHNTKSVHYSPKFQTSKPEDCQTPVAGYFSLTSGISRLTTAHSPIHVHVIRSGKDSMHSNHIIVSSSHFNSNFSIGYCLFRTVFRLDTKKYLSQALESVVVIDTKRLLDIVATADQTMGEFPFPLSTPTTTPTPTSSSSSLSQEDDLTWITRGLTRRTFPSPLCSSLFAYDLLNSIIFPLCRSDGLFISNKYIGITSRYMGLADSGESLQTLAPLYASFLQHQSVTFLVSEVLMKPLSLSPFQRWLRDSLLTFQDSISSLAAHRQKILANAVQNGASDIKGLPYNWLL